MKAKRPCPEALARAADLKSQVATCDAEVATLEAAMGGRPQAASKISGGGGSGGGGGGAGVRDPPSEPGAAGATLAQPHPGGFRALQFTLVDCPGHASLIRTIIGGAQVGEGPQGGATHPVGAAAACASTVPCE